MTNQEQNKNLKTVNFEEHVNVVNMFKETAREIGILRENENFSSELMKSMPDRVKKIKSSQLKASNDQAKFKIFVEEAVKANVKHLDDAYKLANEEIERIEVNDKSNEEIKKLVENMQNTRPYLFQESIENSDIPTDFMSDDTEGSMIETLRQKALETGSPQDIQNYWSARRQIR